MNYSYDRTAANPLRAKRLEAAEHAIMGVAYVRATDITIMAKAVVNAIEAGESVEKAIKDSGDNAEYPLLRKAMKAGYRAAQKVKP